jgi:hypothetical protein
MFLSRITLLAVALTIYLSVSANSHAQTVESDSALAAQLRRSDERLLSAVHTGDCSTWQKFAASDFFYLDEEGGVTYLSDFLQQLAPMATKPLQIRTYKLTRINETAIVLHEDTDENKVRYIFTETWQRLDGTWRLRALHITNVLSDPPAIKLSTAQIEELAGTYRSGSDTLTVRGEGDRIFASRAGAPERERKAETRDVLFTPGEPRRRIIFLRDSMGKVTGLVVRYESSDVLWTKAP